MRFYFVDETKAEKFYAAIEGCLFSKMFSVLESPSVRMERRTNAEQDKVWIVDVIGGKITQFPTNLITHVVGIYLIVMDT